MMAGCGLRWGDIALVVDVDEKTLRKHCQRELDRGKAVASSRVGKSLFEQATTGNTAAAIFWAKVQMGWREKAPEEDGGQGSGGTTIRIVRVEGAV